MLQLSIVWVNADLKVIDEYDVYIKPPDSAEWDHDHACKSHGLRPTDACIVNAKSIVEVWPEFKGRMERHVDGNKVGMILAWNGKGSNCIN